jgi:hypothetical protein
MIPGHDSGETPGPGGRGFSLVWVERSWRAWSGLPRWAHSLAGWAVLLVLLGLAAMLLVWGLIFGGGSRGRWGWLALTGARGPGGAGGDTLRRNVRIVQRGGGPWE